MERDILHLPDHELLQSLDGELTPERARAVEAHLESCWACRERLQALQQSIAEFIRAERTALDPQLPPAEGPRALLRAQMREIADGNASSWTARQIATVAAAAILIVATAAAVSFEIARLRTPPTVHAAIFSPRPELTPGAVVLRSRSEVCAAEHAINRMVPVAIRRSVFHEYGIAEADARAYEVDYLISPALGGSDDIRNLWPQSYASTVWNAHVKDALEDRLRGMVCAGSLDLEVAQRDLSRDWIAAYRKYFHSDQPVEMR
jgi:hypothetical protein